MSARLTPSMPAPLVSLAAARRSDAIVARVRGVAKPQTGFRRGRRPDMSGRIGATVAAAWRRWRTRRTLAGLDERMLKDIGATRLEARDEAAKPFWVG
jgi:uncharacterized protein YjiS (DUF1127 family)